MTKKLYEYNVDESFEICLLIKSADVRMAKNGNPFIAFTFQDQSGQMDGKYWSATSDDIAKYVPGKVVVVNGKREMYNNSPQVKIVNLRLTDASKGEPTSASHFVEHAPMTKEDMEEELKRLFDGITNPTLKSIVRHILKQYQAEFFEYPAAKRHHHAFVGGLSFHTISMLRLAEAIATQYTQINRSLLYSGVILHDIGKTMELTGAIGTEYTLKGNLLGHIVIMDEEITKACEALDIDENQEDVLLLKHLVLAHHGKLEYGSPVRPQLLEAEVLHHIDLLDATITMMSNALDKTEPGAFSERVFGLDNRSFYKPLSHE